LLLGFFALFFILISHTYLDKLEFMEVHSFQEGEIFS